MSPASTKTTTKTTASIAIVPTSLAETVDAVNEAHFFGRPPTKKAEIDAVATWIAGRHALPGAYASTFALFEDERTKGIRLFTGERAASASARHTAGEEACRALRLLQSTDRAVVAALDAANDGLLAVIARAKDSHRERGLPHNDGVF